MARSKKEDKPKRLPQRGKGRPFQPGNNMWMIRDITKVGRPTAFASVEELLSEFDAYVKHVDAHPMNEVVKGMGGVTEIPVMKAGKIVGTKPNTLNLPKALPYTLEGFCVWCSVAPSYFRTFKVTKTQEKHGDFLAAIEIIEATIFNQQYSLSFAGFGNPSLVAARFALATKIEQTNINVHSEPLSADRVKEIAQQLEKDC